MSRVIVLHPGRTAWWLGAIAGVLAAASLGLGFARSSGGLGIPHALANAFNLDAEANVPTFYSTLLLLAAATLLAVIAATKRTAHDSFSLHWTLLSAIFLVLALDEAAGLHERLVNPMRRAWRFSGWLYFAWVVPGVIFVAAMVAAYWRFVFALPSSTRNGLLAAAAVYLSGALGMEMVGGRHLELAGADATYVWITAGEECLEMAGAIVFLYSLLVYIRETGIQIRIGAGP